MKSRAVTAALEEAIAIAGSAAALARLIGVTRQAITIAKGKGRISWANALAIEAVTGVSRRRLAPHVYPEGSGEPPPLGLRAERAERAERRDGSES